MARVFTTSFEFNHQRYDAIVTITSKDSQLNFNVRLLDVDLLSLFPEGQIKYCGPDGFEQLAPAENAMAQQVVRRLGEAINRHLLQTK